MAESAIVAEHVSRKYTMYARPTDRLKELLTSGTVHEDFWALQDVTFNVRRGETLGVVGKNGSGKSTLLQLLAGVLQPTRGHIDVRGRVSALLELGAGFNPEFSGVENVILNGAILGVPESEMRERMERIAGFADIGDFLYKPVKTYSSGMYVRLAFATAINIDPDVLLVDEALAVGDAYFQHRCMLRMAELQASGVTIVVVSHDTAAIKRLCDNAIWLDAGRIIDCGAPERVVARYLASLFQQPEREVAEAPAPRADADPAEAVLSAPNVDRRFGDAAAEVIGIAITDVDGRAVTSQVHGAPFVIRIQARFHQRVVSPMIGFVLRDRLGTDLASSNTTLENMQLPPAQADDTYIVSFTCQPPHLHPGHYSISATVAGGDLSDYAVHDWIDTAATLELTGQIPMYTVMRFPIVCSLEVVRAPSTAVLGQLS